MLNNFTLNFNIDFNRNFNPIALWQRGTRMGDVITPITPTPITPIVINAIIPIATIIPIAVIIPIAEMQTTSLAVKIIKIMAWADKRVINKIFIKYL